MPDYLHGLFDDAGPLRADDSALPGLVAEHLPRRSATVRSLVVPDRMLPALGRVVGESLPVTVVVTGGAGALEPAVTWAASIPGIEFRGLRTALRESDAGDLAPNARRVVTVVDQLLGAGLLAEDVEVEVTPSPLAGEPSASWLSALDELAAAGLGLALSTDRVSARELATCIGAALDRELAVSLRGDLSHRHARVGDDGAVRPGFLGALLAVRASLDGAQVGDVTAVLADGGPAEVASPDALVAARRWLRSVEVSALDKVAAP